jgi:hypothetical protein
MAGLAAAPLAAQAQVRLAVAPLAAQVQVRLAMTPSCLQPEEAACLAAECAAPAPEGAEPPAWTWSLLPGAANRWELAEPLGTLEPGPGGSCRYVAPADPFPLGKRQVRVRVAPQGRPELAVTQAITITTSLGEMLFNRLPHIREYLGVEDLRRPALGMLAGSPEQRGCQPGEREAARFDHPRFLAWSFDHPDPGAAGRWLVLDQHGERIQLLDELGAVKPWLDLLAHDAAGACYGGLCLAVRPPGPGAGPWRAVLVGYDHAVWQLDGQGKLTVLAGKPTASGYRNGPAARSRFHRPMAAVIGADGAVYVADWGNRCLRRIRDGEVSTLAGNPLSGPDAGARDGKGAAATFLEPFCLDQDARSGDLFVADGGRIRQVSPAGEVTTLAGAAWVAGLAGGTEQALPAEGAEPPPRRPGLGEVAGLAVRGGQVFLADQGRGAISVLDPATGELTTLAGGPGRPGGGFVLGRPRHLAFSPEGRCLVAANTGKQGEGWCIAELSLPGGPGPTPAQ